MLEFSDQPYRYFPPRYSRVLAAMIRWHNRVRYLPRTLRVESVRAERIEAVSGAARQRDVRLVLLANHPTHADAPVLLEAARQAGLRPGFMAAYDVFLRGRRTRFVMQSLGAFSVDREGSDSRAVKQAMATLEDPRLALTIFPEGNVYLQNDRVTPLHEGAAFIAVRGAKELADRGLRVLAAPVSIKLTLAVDARAVLSAKLRELASAVDVQLGEKVTPLEALRAIGVEALRRNLRHRRYEVDESDDLRMLIESSAEAVLDRLEAKLGVTPKAGDSLTDRVRACRRKIHEVRTDESRAADHGAAAVWADEAMLAMRIISYSGRYVAEHPTQDRIAETTEKLAEDIYGRMIEPLATRWAIVRFGEPMDVGAYVGEGRKARTAVRELTGDVERAIQHGLDEVNANNDSPGAAIWTEPLGA